MWSSSAAASKQEFALLVTADVSFAQLYPRADGPGVQLVNSPLVDVVGWSTADGANGVSLSVGRRADDFTVQTMQLAGPEACTVGVTSNKVCISTRGSAPATWLLEFADEAEKDSLLAFIEMKRIQAARAELFARPMEASAASIVDVALSGVEDDGALLQRVVAHPDWSAFVDAIERAAMRLGVDLLAQPPQRALQDVAEQE